MFKYQSECYKQADVYKSFLFVLKDSQSCVQFLKGFSCSQIVMFTVEDSSKFLTRHGSVIAMLHFPSTPHRPHVL